MVKFKTRKKKEKNKSKWIVIATVVIMTLSTAGFLLLGNGGGNADEYEYNGFKLVRTQNGWQVRLDTGVVYFYGDPSQAYKYNISQDIINQIRNSPYFYMTSEVNTSISREIALAEYDITNLLLSHYNIYATTGFLEKNEFNSPVITCANATQFVPVIVFTESNVTEATKVNNCIFFAAANGRDVLGLRDRLLYGVFGVL